jgi:hypothetical protein
MAKASIPTAPPQFATEVEAIRAALNDPSLTSEGRVLGMLAEVETFQASPEREAALRDVLKQFAAFVREQRANIADQSTLVREARELYKAAQALARPIPVLTPAEVVRAVFSDLQEKGGRVRQSICLRLS